MKPEKWISVQLGSLVAFTCLMQVSLAQELLISQDLQIEAPINQTKEQALAKSGTCLNCHQGIEKMHASELVQLGCTDCHGGDPTCPTKEGAHVQPCYPDRWPTSANPEATFALLNQERNAWIQFINPGDWRVADRTCAACHQHEVAVNKKSLMGHSTMVPGSALYNNGSTPNKIYRYGENYGPDGRAQRVFSAKKPTMNDVLFKGILPYIDPLPDWRITQPGIIFRILEINNNANSLRGPGTDARIDGVFLNVVKTKLNDPTMVFLGTNDHPGDFRSSGCTSCHVLYANDRDPAHSAHIAHFGNKGFSATDDPSIPKNEPGHPIKHQLTTRIPSSQCMTCHFHQGSGALGNYYGYMWWDYESDSKEVYTRYGNPINSGAIGSSSNKAMWDLWEDVNPQISGNKFADFHNAGWPFQAVYKRDDKGNMLDQDGNKVSDEDPDWHKKVVHMADIHLERGMHCVDCHFYQDVHGDGNLYGAMIDAIEINCKDCHGTVYEKANLVTSNPAGGNDLSSSRVMGKRRFEVREDGIYQRSAVTEGLEWKLTQIKDIITPGHADYNEKARLAKTLQRDGKTWGHAPEDPAMLAHANSSMTCYACHSSWNNNCSGCHLDAQTNLRTEVFHYEGGFTKFYSAYNPQTLNADGFMLGKNGTVQGHRVSPVRSASAVVVSARAGQREMVLHQQPTISAEGYSGHAYTPNPPHTVRIKETRTCSDCHLSVNGDNNAKVSQALGFGVRKTDFIGRYLWVAEDTGGIQAVRVTAGDEFPQPVIGSNMHEILDPVGYSRYSVNGVIALREAHHHKSNQARDIQKFGEWVFVADGPGGLRTFDAANIANKNEAQKLVESGISPLGQVIQVKSRCATSIGLPNVLPVDPCRTQRPENDEQEVSDLFKYLFLTDLYEGMIVIDVQTLIDGDPDNNFLRRATTFNPDGILSGAVGIKIAGNYAYVLTEQAGLVVVDISEPCSPNIVNVLSAPGIIQPTSIETQFRYAFITDAEGLKVVDIIDPTQPKHVASVPVADARNVCVMRTYAYVAAGANGVAIIDVQNPAEPGEVTYFDGNGSISDASAIVAGATYASLFIYVADGLNGVKVVEVVSPKLGSKSKGFSPEPAPRLIACYPTPGPARALSEGMSRDRYVDEDGNQIGVFGRRGSRPFNRPELRRMYLKDGVPYLVSDEPPGPPSDQAAKKPVNQLFIRR